MKLNLNFSEVKVDKRSNLSRKELYNEYIKPEIPVVLKDAAKDWNAMGKITPEFFKKNYPDVTKQIGGVPYRMSDYIDLMLAPPSGKPVPYPFNFNVEKFFPELLADIKPEILYAKLDRVHHALMPHFMFGNTHVYEFFLGGAGSRWPTLHIDLLFLHNQMTQLYGSKTFFLYPPDQVQYLYLDPENPKKSLVNIFNPDYDRFPLFRKAKCITVTVEEGETILHPGGWWHTTQMDGPCISLGRVQLNASNWDAFCRDNFKKWKENRNMFRTPALAYTTMVGYVMNIQEFFM